jgi:putative photosynthetic complex assembly protein
MSQALDTPPRQAGTTRTKDPHAKAALACGGMIAVALALAFFGRHPPTIVTIDPAAVSRSLDLAFRDLPDGSVMVVDATTGQDIQVIAPGGGGFVRVTMRSYARERMQRGLSDATPFHLAEMTDGTVFLQDRLTGRTMHLNAFGPANVGAFRAILDHGRATR